MWPAGELYKYNIFIIKNILALSKENEWEGKQDIRRRNKRGKTEKERERKKKKGSI